MITEFLIFGLLLISFTINLLALGAFWVTPGLRTTANRFVINLLVVNLFGCIVLAPTLFLNHSNLIEENIVKVQIKNHLNNNNNNINNYDNKNNNSEQITETLLKCNSSRCEKITIENDRSSNSESIVITEIDIINNNNNNDPDIDDFITDNDNKQNTDVNQLQQQQQHQQQQATSRWWSLDLAAALGALSVLLVVGDTWCAVTDPLRYHSRISGLKSWILIATAWFLSILFGVLSALRENAFQTTTTTTTVNDRDDLEIITSNNNGHQHDESYYDNDQIIRTTIAGVLYNTNNNNSLSTIPIQANDLYNMIFSSIYFIFIILLPFGFVCGMYWRIFSEARENGLRVRQNGSSPLLQSALNLSSASSIHNNSVHNNIHHQHLVKDICSSTATGGLSMNIDRRRSSDRDVMKPLLFPIAAVHRPSQQSNSSSDERQLPSSSLIKQDRNQNILLTLSAASEEVMRRNYSAKQLSSVLGSSDEDLIIETMKTTDDDRRITNKASIRHVHSTPNLQKSHDNNKFINGGGGGGGIGIDYSHNALQLPTTIIQASPKALSYMTSIRHRLSNASSLFKYREESRAARISILVVIMFLVSYLPYGLLVLLQSRLMNLLGNSTQIAVLMVLMGHLSSPFIFAYRNKRVRRGVKRLFGLDQRSRDSSDFHRNGGGGGGSSGGLLRTGTKASINVRRSASKASTYSVNSCSKFLAPHAVNNGTTFLMDNEKCHYLNIKTTNCQKGGAIIEQILKDPDKRSILKIVCDSSRKLGCASNSCANSDNEQTDV